MQSPRKFNKLQPPKTSMGKKEEAKHNEENGQMKKKKEELHLHNNLCKVHGQNEGYLYVHKALPQTFGTHQLVLRMPQHSYLTPQSI